MKSLIKISLIIIGFSCNNLNSRNNMENNFAGNNKNPIIKTSHKKPKLGFNYKKDELKNENLLLQDFENCMDKNFYRQLNKNNFLKQLKEMFLIAVTFNTKFNIKNDKENETINYSLIIYKMLSKWLKTIIFSFEDKAALYQFYKHSICLTKKDTNNTLFGKFIESSDEKENKRIQIDKLLFPMVSMFLTPLENEHLKSKVFKINKYKEILNPVNINNLPFKTSIKIVKYNNNCKINFILNNIEYEPICLKLNNFNINLIDNYQIKPFETSIKLFDNNFKNRMNNELYLNQFIDYKFLINLDLPNNLIEIKNLGKSNDLKCSICKNDAKYLCNKCKKIRYCSQKCEFEDSTKHKIECKTYYKK